MTIPLWFYLFNDGSWLKIRQMKPDIEMAEEISKRKVIQVHMINEIMP